MSMLLHLVFVFYHEARGVYTHLTVFVALPKATHRLYCSTTRFFLLNFPLQSLWFKFITFFIWAIDLSRSQTKGLMLNAADKVGISVRAINTLTSCKLVEGSFAKFAKLVRNIAIIFIEISNMSIYPLRYKCASLNYYKSH